MNLLIIDDDPMTRLLMREALAHDDFTIIEADNAETGIALALNCSPDLILLDIVMPKMDGFACFAVLREQLAGCCVSIPVVMLTAMDDNASIERAFALGATDFIHKPINWSLLAHRLRFVMRSHIATCALTLSEERLRLSMCASRQGCYDLNLSTGHSVVSAEFATMLGFNPSHFEESYSLWLQRLHPDDRDHVISAFQAYLAGTIPEYRVEFRHLCADGSWKWILSVGSIVERDANGTPLRMLGTHTDINHLKHNEQRLRLLAKVFENSGEGIIVCDASHKIVEVNASFTQITRYSSADIIGKSPNVLCSRHHKRTYYDALKQSINDTGYWQGEINGRRKTGEYFPAWLSVSAVRDTEQTLTHYIAVFSDITERKAIAAKIEYLAHHDPLTHLPNRTLLRDRFDQAIAHATRNQSSGALLFLDLDHFKLINDTLGHDVGDSLLKSIATRLAQCLREIDTICRQGGDEFIILLTDLRDNEAITQITQKILQQLHEPFIIDGQRITTSFSIGISSYPADGQQFIELLNKADTAMYVAKKQGRNTFCFFSSDMNNASIERLNLENGLRGALANNELSLYYQPQYCMDNHKLVGVEALLRWQTAAGELLTPVQFMPIAEDMALIVPMGHWVLHEACRQTRLWHDQGNMLTVAVNISAVQFKHGNLVASVQSALALSGLEPRYLELDMTESTLMQNTEVIIKIMTELTELGVTFALDNFGMGYASLSYLKRFSVNNLKIAQSFINELTQGRTEGQAIIKAIIQLGQTLNIQVLAKGVETKDQFDQLKQLGCDKAQGFYVNRPFSALEFEHWVLAGQHPLHCQSSG